MATTRPEDIQVLEWPDAVRKRPGMYIGDTTSPAAIHHMLWDVVGGGIAEHQRGNASSIAITIDGARVTIEDDGTGMPRETLEVALTRFLLHTRMPPGLDCPLLYVTNALSKELSIESWHGGRAYRACSARGRSTRSVEELGATTRHGTRIAFEPDFTLLPPHPWDHEGIAHTCRELAALQPGLALTVDGDAVCYPRGLRDHLAYLADDPDLIEPLHVRTEHAGIGVDVAVAPVRGRGRLFGFANHRACRGTNVDGLIAGIRAAFRGRAPWSRLESELLAIVHVTLDDAQYRNIEHDPIINPEVATAVAATVEPALRAHFEQAPAFLDAVLLGL